MAWSSPSPSLKSMGSTTPTTFVFLAFIFLFSSLSNSLPLLTRGRWIIDSATGRRVKLVCVNWPSHTQSMLIEGLDRKPLKDLADEALRLRFNCVRLTYATHMFTRYANRTIEENFDLLDLKTSKVGLALHNPFVLNMTISEAYETVVDVLGASGLMVIADNHISQPRWCCSLDDGNGFFGDRYFDSEEWLKGLRFVARRFHNKSTVVGMSLRNELRGAKSNPKDWNKYITQGATAIHTINPNTLIIISGLNFDNDLRCQIQSPISQTKLQNKLVLEVHLYSFSGEPQTKLIKNPLNKICSKIMNGFEEQAGFVMEGEMGVPLFVSEFGLDNNYNEADERFLSCFGGYLARKDLDWALWGWQGSYYYRQGQARSEEVFGVLNYDWSRLRNPHFPHRFHLLQTMLQDPNSKFPNSYIMYHPQSGQCAQVQDMMSKEIYLNNCSNASHWSHEGDGTPIKLEGTGLCLRAIGDGLQPSLSRDCLGEQSGWSAISDSKLHLATLTKQWNNGLCLERESSNSTRIVMGRCVCVGDDSNCLQDTQPQWFELVVTNTL